MWNPQNGTGYGVKGLGMSTSVIDVLYQLRNVWFSNWIILRFLSISHNFNLFNLIISSKLSFYFSDLNK